MNQLSHHSVDVLISGAGPVGLTLACLLKSEQPSLAVTLADPKLASDAPISQADKRTIAMSAATQSVYEGLDIWRSISASVGRIETIIVSDRGHVGKTRLGKQHNQGEDLGYVVDQARLKNALRTQANKLGVRFISQSVKNVQSVAAGARIELGDQTLIQSSLLVIAEGANSPTRELLGIQQETFDYAQTAIVTTVKHEKKHLACALERFTPSGPIALLPLRSPFESALVMCSTPKSVQEVEELNETQAAEEQRELSDSSHSLMQRRGTMARDSSSESFLKALHSQVGYPYGRFTSCGERLSFPLKLTQAKEQVRHSVVLVGNAFRSLHPVAGQGYNLAIRSCVELTAAVCSLGDYACCEKPVGGLERLYLFEQRMRADNAQTVLLSHGLHRIFTDELVPALARTLGLAALDNAGGLQGPIFAGVMGRVRPRAHLSIFSRSSKG